MSWRSLLITQHSKLTYKMNHLVITTQTDVIQVPIDDVRVVIVGTTRAAVTSYAVMEIIKHDIKLIFTSENGMPIGEINRYHGHTSRNINILKQFKWSDMRKQQLWQLMIQTKITVQQQVLEETSNNSEAMDKLVDSVEVGDETNREAVAARLYFPRLFGKNFTRRDDKQVQNGALNYGYGILIANLAREISEFGYLTELGIHHDNANNEFNLANDLMELFRPLVDRIVYLQDKGELTNAMKGDLINVINLSVGWNGKETQITTVITEVVRTSLLFLEEKSELPEWRIEI
ncbi:type II CRISPR-associated endonuclease Cas1 [Periweissella cryptocerci]|uniref:CRISPR-associated endonuclease Cas1 n=1 Tax=Periweissella cryptocerci TaxID=2506420 RepID=A0A4P6YVS3_9LACO|nr:type II CRISPR-associated endonuclease Cas1 [Periweissella cryptocerci]QBO36922.1 type II CRISPR-associated endonuclease Cas1 [Periweissella cryptocerci]